MEGRIPGTNTVIICARCKWDPSSISADFVALASKGTVLTLMKPFLCDPTLRGPLESLLAEAIIVGRWMKNDSQTAMLLASFNVQQIVVCDLHDLLRAVDAFGLVRTFCLFYLKWRKPLQMRGCYESNLLAFGRQIRGLEYTFGNMKSDWGFACYGWKIDRTVDGSFSEAFLQRMTYAAEEVLGAVLAFHSICSHVSKLVFSQQSPPPRKALENRNRNLNVFMKLLQTLQMSSEKMVGAKPVISLRL